MSMIGYCFDLGKAITSLQQYLIFLQQYFSVDFHFLIVYYMIWVAECKVCVSDVVLKRKHTHFIYQLYVYELNINTSEYLSPILHDTYIQYI